MAAHLLIDDNYVGETDSETKAIKDIIKTIRQDLRDIRETSDITDFEAKYDRLHDDYLEDRDTEVYTFNTEVPETIVWGGQATIEVHLRGTFINKIYLVA